MRACADCGGAARWCFDDPGARSVDYCDACLPPLLRPRASNGSLTKVPVPKVTKEP